MAVVCGVHFDGLGQMEIARITKLPDSLSQTILDSLKQDHPGRRPFGGVLSFSPPFEYTWAR